jgi:serine/threonine-protein kinase
VLPFPGVVAANSVAVDTAGNLYVTEQDNHKFAVDNHPRVWKLAAGASAPTQLPFPDLKEPQGVAVDNGGNLYITDGYENRVWKLAGGSAGPTALPFTGLKNPAGVAVDATGNVYVADRSTKQIVKLAAGANNSAPLPLPALERVDAVEVDTAGDIYVTDWHDQCTALKGPCAFQVDTGRLGDGRVLKLAAGAETPTVLPLTGLDYSRDVTVDGAGNVFIVDGTDRVIELPVQG